jgi:hypothetical protein
MSGNRVQGCVMMTGNSVSVIQIFKITVMHRQDCEKNKIFYGKFSKKPYNFFNQLTGLVFRNFQVGNLYDYLFCPEQGPDLFGEVFANLS